MIFPQQEKIVSRIDHILTVFQESKAEIRPHFHLTGSTGSGKSFLLKRAADILRLPIIEINAAGLTAEGLSGNSLSKALRKLREHWNEPNVVFVDEFDKLFQRNGEKTEDFRIMVQDEFLMALESQYASIFTEYGKYEPVRIDNSIFIFAGSYSGQNIRSTADLRDAGVRAEFVGRVPLVFHTDVVPLEELEKCIDQLALWQSYIALYPRTKKSQAVQWIIKRMREQDKESHIGIRLMNSVIHQYFMKDI